MIHLPSFVGFARLFIALCWIGFIAGFSLRKRPAGAATERRVRESVAGIVLQSIAIGLVWTLLAERFPDFALPEVAMRLISVLAVLLAAASVWLVVDAIRVLGRQWSIQARLVEGHRLVVEGPYSHMRHPIYTGMLGMLLATGLAFSVWWTLLIAVPIFAVGTAIRVRAEERLLHEAFGEDYEAYRRYVPAILPRWKTRS
ncbi:MAG TPA: isoprenylcysteine carboxylmethyltransferase family protein [Candidatus Acidoferrales bacterium]|nr:isoprenylcysteine carboxylmethyltransferase family protein [Candidatus Acidoferrales bacterium]